jgi:hypothetical protein
MRATCKICEAPNDARSVVDKLLSQGVFLRDVAAQTGFSKSAIHRHSQKCYVRAAAGALKGGYFDPDRQRVVEVVKGKYYLDQDPKTHYCYRGGEPIELQPDQLREDDFLYTVSIDPPIPPKPAAIVPPEFSLLPEPAKPEIQPVEASKNGLN